MRPARISATAPGTPVKGGSKVRMVCGIDSFILADGRLKQQKRRDRMKKHEPSGSGIGLVAPDVSRWDLG
jgi:hypothetical protein